MTLGEALELLFQCHRGAPFLCFNGNTFGEIARRIVDAVFIEFPLARRREAVRPRRWPRTMSRVCWTGNPWNGA
jgi:hypothetical protein